MLTAITRQISPAIGRCELTHLQRDPIDLERARRQHLLYERCLESLGCRLLSLPAEPELPDSVFVEDAAVVLDELAVIAQPGAESRRKEIESVALALQPHRSLVFIGAPGTLDGGDVLRCGRRIWVGAGGRSDDLGIRQLRALLAPHGYRVIAVPVRGCLHLKSAATRVAEETLLINRRCVDAEAFDGLDLIDVDPAEPHAANALEVAGTLVFPSHHPRTLDRLEARGLAARTVEVGELAKAEAGVTCCSLVFES